MTFDQAGRSLKISGVSRLCVVGAGTMGAQIAQVVALHGYQVNLADVNPVALEKAVEGNRFQLQNRVNRGKLSQPEMDAALARVQAFSSIEEAASNADFVIEAIGEDLEVKRNIFWRLDAICPPHTILASNSSAFVISQIARDVKRKDKVVNMHFFHPALVMQLVEIVGGPETSDETIEVTLELGKQIGKESIVINKDVFGCIVNNVPVVEFARAEMKAGYGRAVELVGTETNRAGRQARFKESNDPRDLPPTFLEEMVREGRVGRKPNRDFFDLASSK